ncbi:YggS family pyridoxal phosphate-dependent enzyme [Taklimakanibacter albus]|uniref:YggS family pyridoxal phosphate-dependent enzyme n=1 Tax=Taklimakanibacter albus TaxID=2800327 RepID=A0ACC5QWP0_9HYPH|nr:YggS family pyridoxal phosphate-dependent enzyme [Aestuariivirga sp. YIM B02566]MBK1864789.1 YggS family pyridoxal phosphate-dependent enzyme [Aestuariivirga sp. YIM B02566]
MSRHPAHLDVLPPHPGLTDVRQRIAAAAAEAGRPLADITLVAVSKTFEPAAIEPVIEAGQRVFGENRVQESKAKWPELKSRFAGITLHLIGPLQSNKAAEAVALFDCIQTLDREKLARVLADEIQRQGRQPDLFVEINTGEEEQKAGIRPREADRFIAACRDTYGLKIAGLMCIPPADEEPALHFALLETIAKRNGLKQLSMGMSADFETAIRFGATHVRVGSAIFGERFKKLA